MAKEYDYRCPDCGRGEDLEFFSLLGNGKGSFFCHYCRAGKVIVVEQQVDTSQKISSNLAKKYPGRRVSYGYFIHKSEV